MGNYWHTFFRDLPSLAAVGVPRTLTFRSFEYQAVAIARLWAGRSVRGLPGPEEQARWEAGREQATRRDGRRFHDIPWEDGETHHWLGGLFEIAGLGTLTGDGRIPLCLAKSSSGLSSTFGSTRTRTKGRTGGKKALLLPLLPTTGGLVRLLLRKKRSRRWSRRRNGLWWIDLTEKIC